MRFFCSIALIILSIFSNSISANTDPYPKNRKIDILNYIFEITLSDTTDEIDCLVTVDLRAGP